jgi:pimeloyl-ACP methyl ester carboxylesterase
MHHIIRLAILLLAVPMLASANERQLSTKQIVLPNGISINYMENGPLDAVPVIFIHGTLGDMPMWEDYITTFGKNYRAIAYSRRYNYPNENALPPGSNHSTAVEAADLAELIQELELPKAHIVGYSYGGYTALHLAVDHPELVRSLVLAEPPLIPWLANLPANKKQGRFLFERQQTHFVNPARRQIAEGDVEGAIKTFVDYVVEDGAFDKMPPAVKQAVLDNSLEFRAEVTSKAMFAPLTRREVASIEIPTLMLSGQKSMGALKLTDAELEKTLPGKFCRRVTIDDATHLMWQENPVACTKALMAFFETH